MPTYSLSAGEGAPAPKKFKLNLDESEAEEGFDEANCEGDDSQETHLPDSYFELLESTAGAAWHGMPKRRRLWGKTSPLLTGYPNTSLVSRTIYKIVMAKRKLDVAANKRDKSIAMAAALKLLAAQPSQGEDGSSSRQREPARKFGIPHPSHHINSLSRQFDIIYCRNCSAWSKNDKLKALGDPCQGLLKGNRAQMRLLEEGIIPLAGVRMPAHLRKNYARGRRR